jgi:phosphoribosyl-dephospho-CoA transferase
MMEAILAASSAAPQPARLPALLRRHQLIRLSVDGWARVLQAPWDPAARRCLDLWSARGFPLVVTRQPEGRSGLVAAGLPAPARYRRRRLALAVAASDLLFFDEFPAAGRVTPLLHGPVRAHWAALLGGLAAAGCAARVYGSYGWQSLTRLVYLHADSDLDLLLPVGGVDDADAACAALAASASAGIGPRLDGELLFPDGGAVAWREWLGYRQGRTDCVLVKRLHGVALERPQAEPAGRPGC